MKSVWDEQSISSGCILQSQRLQNFLCPAFWSHWHQKLKTLGQVQHVMRLALFMRLGDLCTCCNFFNWEFTSSLKAFISVCTHSVWVGFGWLTWRMRPAVVTDSMCVDSFEAKIWFWLQSPIFMTSQHQCRICNCCHSDWRFYVFCAHERPQCSQAQDAWHKLPCIWCNSLQDELEFEWDLCCSEFEYSLQHIVPAWWWKKKGLEQGKV